MSQVAFPSLRISWLSQSSDHEAEICRTYVQLDQTGQAPTQLKRSEVILSEIGDRKAEPDMIQPDVRRPRATPSPDIYDLMRLY